MKAMIIKEINFCSNLIKNTSLIYNDIGKKLNKLKKEKPDLSVRDYTWNILMNLSNELTNDGLKKYNKIVKLPYRDRALEVFDVVKTFSIKINITTIFEFIIFKSNLITL